MDTVKPANYRSLLTWQKAMDLVDAVYDLTESWPQRDMFGLTSQVRRAVVSVPANIAEGSGRSGKKEDAHHVSIAHGSLLETETLERRRQTTAFYRCFGGRATPPGVG